MRRRGIELSRRHQWWLYASFALLFISGVAWQIAHYFLAPANGVSGLPHPSEPLWLKLHGAAAMATLIILGSVLPLHVKHAWLLKKNRWSGALFLGLNGVLVATGYGLYYAGAEELRAFLSLSHGMVGLAFAPLLALHVWLGKRSRRASQIQK
ncbi:MAG TPA: hypothetical protein VEO95_10590 [Chthoniobacteraceae bacterium]|nr:hypothetical protein [Chthoniobacteraceae bacterium]